MEAFIYYRLKNNRKGPNCFALDYGSSAYVILKCYFYGVNYRYFEAFLKLMLYKSAFLKLSTDVSLQIIYDLSANLKKKLFLTTCINTEEEN